MKSKKERKKILKERKKGMPHYYTATCRLSRPNFVDSRPQQESVSENLLISTIYSQEL